MKQLLLVIAALVTISVAAQAQYDSNQVRRVGSLPATCTLGTTNPVTYNGVVYHCTATNTWTKSNPGQLPTSTYAGLPTCAAGNDGQIYRITDGSRGYRACRNTTGSTYAWVDDNPIVKPEAWGWATAASAANNATYLQAAIDAAIAAGIGVVELPAGTYEWSTSITFSAGNLTIRGQGQATVLRFSGSGPAFRNSDWTSVKSNIHFKDFWLYAYGSAINNATSVGIDLSSLTDCVVSSVYTYNFGTGILLDGHRPATATAYSTYYNKIVNSFIGASSDSYTNCVRGVSILNGANSNTIDNLKTSRYTNPISLGDGSYESPNQIEIKNPVVEAHLGPGINIVKGYGIKISGGRFEGAHTAIKVTDAIADTAGIMIESPYFQISGVETVIDTKNPTVWLNGGSLNNMALRQAGIGASGTNLIPNANMEGWGNSGSTTLLGWFNVSGTTWTAATSNSSRVTTPIASGTYASQISSSVGAGQASQVFPVVAGQPYTFSYYSASNSTTNGHRPMIRWFDSAGTQITSGWGDPSYYGVGDNFSSGISSLSYSGTYNAWIGGADTTHSATNTYVRRAGVLTPPTGAVTAQFAIVVITTGGGLLFVDEFQFVAGAAQWQSQDRPAASGGSQTIYGNLTLPKLTTADPSSGAGSLEISVQGGESRLRELNGGRAYYDAYSHVFRDHSGTEFWRLDQNGTLTPTAGTLAYRNSTATLAVGANAINLLSPSANLRTWTFGAGNATLSFTNIPTGELIIILVQDSTGGRTITWPAECKWAGGTLPALSTAASATDVFSFICNGTSCFLKSAIFDVK